jgi:hypothetical protein
VKLKQLRRTHADYADKTWRRYEDLFKGGDRFKAQLQEYLPQNALETTAAYKRRQRSAYYINYCGPIGTSSRPCCFRRRR